MEKEEGLRDSGIGESVTSSPSLEEVASSKEAVQQGSPVGQSLTQESTTVKKRLIFDEFEECTDGRPAKKALCMDRLVDVTSMVNSLPETNPVNDSSDSVPLNTQFMTSEDFITSAQGPGRPSSSGSGVLLDLTATEETHPLRHHHFSLFTPRCSGAGAQVHQPSRNSSGRYKGPHGGLRIGKP